MPMTDVAPPPPAPASRGVTVTANVLGGIGVLLLFAGIAEAAALLSRGLAGAANPVFGNIRRLAHTDAVRQLATDYAQNFFIVATWWTAVLALAVVFAALVRAVRRPSTTAAAVAGVFLAAAILNGVLIGTSILKLAELAVQSTRATAAEQAWMERASTSSSSCTCSSSPDWYSVSAWGGCSSAPPRRPTPGSEPRDG
ncbi:MAG TPA: hypothetical protein VM364_02185 [Vicinamibacterales bacterium]|nr:hypothetical protein [Vicinamibacterales bacterium]